MAITNILEEWPQEEVQFGDEARSEKLKHANVSKQYLLELELVHVVYKYKYTQLNFN